MTQPNRCTSIYQNVNVYGQPIGPQRRCTRPVGHSLDDEHDMHRNFTPGHKVKWPERAAHPSEYDAALRDAVADGHVPDSMRGVPKEIVEQYIEKRRTAWKP